MFGISAGTIRTSLSRMASAGEVTANDGWYELDGRLLERQQEQDRGRLVAPTPWDGSWYTVLVPAEQRTLAERRRFRQQALRARLGELRPEVWMRPTNIEIVPERLGAVVIMSGSIDSGDPVELTESLWDVEEVGGTAGRLLERLEKAAAALERDGDAALPDTFMMAAETMRFLRAEPLLPSELLPDSVAAVTGALRQTYDTAEDAIQARLKNFFRRAL